MARQVGIILKGRMDGLSYYYDRRLGYMVRETGGATSKQFRTDKRYAAAREASREFTHVSRAGKLIREALGDFLLPVKDGTMVNRLNKELVALKQIDKTHLRGERRPEVMMTDENANGYFRIFQFNDGAKLYDLLEGYPTKQLSTNVSIAPLYAPAHRQRAGSWQAVQLKATAFPEGATHAGLTVVRTVIDFERGCYTTTASRMAMVSLAGNTGQTLVIPDIKADTGTELVCLQVLFFREENGDLVQVSGKVHSMGVVGCRRYKGSEELVAAPQIPSILCTGLGLPLWRGIKGEDNPQKKPRRPVEALYRKKIVLTDASRLRVASG